MLVLSYLSLFFLVLGSFFLVSAIVGLIRYNDFYIKLHTLTMFNVYGMSLILFSLGILTFDPVIFFEVLFLIAVNIITTLTVVSVLFRNAILNNIMYKAKTRDEIVQEEMLEAQKKANMIVGEKAIKIAKESLHNRLSDKDREKLKKMEEKELKKKKVKEEKEQKKKNKEEKKTAAVAKKTTKQPAATKPEVKQQPVKQEEITPKAPPPAPKEPIKKPENKPKIDVEIENEELKKKIREQKKILRKKIETVRKNAFITRKPEEIQKAEDLIKSILDKYHLTEEMLEDDYEED